MAAGPTYTSDVTDIIPELLEMAVQGVFKAKTAFINSILVSSGAITVNGGLPGGKRPVLGQTVRIPYFSTLGDFEDRTESQAATLKKIQTTSETAVVAAARLAFELTRSAREAGDEDPYPEHARQIGVSAQRKMDALMIAAAQTSPLLINDYDSGTSPVYLTHQGIATGKARRFGDEQDGFVALVAHSLTIGDLESQTDANGRPLNLVSTSETGVKRFAGLPIVQSDSMPLTGSSMRTLTSVGAATPPTLTLTGTPNGPHDLRIEIVDVTGGTARANSTFRFSLDDGGTWSATLECADFATATALNDTAVDSLIGKNGVSGLTLTIADDQAFNASHAWVSRANLKVETQLWMPGAGAFWYNEEALALQTDKDILNDTDIGAMHLYHCAHMYRRRNGGARPGVLRFQHNVKYFNATSALPTS